MRVPTTKATGLSEDEIFGVFLTANDYPGGTAWETAWSGEQSYVLDAAFKHFDAATLGTARTSGPDAISRRVTIDLTTILFRAPF